MSREIPEYVRNRLRTFFKIDAEDALSRPQTIFGGKSAARWVADGDGTWHEVLDRYEMVFSYQTGPL